MSTLTSISSYPMVTPAVTKPRQLPWCLLFVQKSQLSRKIPILIAIVILHQKTHGARRGVGEAARGNHAIVGCGQGWARALVWRGRLSRPPTLPFGLLKALDLNIIGGFVIFRETHPRSTADAILIPGIGSSVLAPCQDGDSGEIITIVIITASPSTIHDSPIHV